MFAESTLADEPKSHASPAVSLLWEEAWRGAPPHPLASPPLSRKDSVKSTWSSLFVHPPQFIFTLINTIDYWCRGAARVVPPPNTWMKRKNWTITTWTSLMMLNSKWKTVLRIDYVLFCCCKSLFNWFLAEVVGIFFSCSPLRNFIPSYQHRYTPVTPLPPSTYPIHIPSLPLPLPLYHRLIDSFISLSPSTPSLSPP